MRKSLVVLALLVLGLWLASFRPPRYDAPFPDIVASSDPTIIARGRYLAEGPAHCTVCHQSDLRGGFTWQIPLGTFYSRNITPDAATGIGKRTDGELARTLRYGVLPDGRATLPFMPFADLSDADLGAVISFLRAQAPVQNEVPPQALNFLGRLVRLFLLKPSGPSAPPPTVLAAEPTAAYGKYLAHSVANCAGCHTNRDKTGAFIGEPFAGGLEIESHEVPGRLFTTPNLTPDQNTGRITQWTEDQFVARFKVGAGAEGSPMPWKSFGHMSDDDLRAIHRYLRSLAPVQMVQK